MVLAYDRSALTWPSRVGVVTALSRASSGADPPITAETARSLACALATTALQLELFRALQGVGGAVLFATATPLLRAEFSGAALARALGAFGTTLGGASAIGPPAGGVLTDTLGPDLAVARIHAMDSQLILMFEGILFTD